MLNVSGQGTAGDASVASAAVDSPPSALTRAVTASAAGVAAFAGVAMLAFRPGVEYDTWWHLAIGRWIAEHGTIPQVDPFSYPRLGEPWHAPGWPGELVFFWVHRELGVPGLVALVGIVFVATFAIVWIRLSGRPLLRASVIVWCATVAMGAVTPRPLVLSLLILSAVLAIASWSRRTPAVAWLLVPSMVVWSNVHGGFPLGVVVVGAHVAEELARLVFAPPIPRPGTRRLTQLIAVVAAMSAACVVNPHGWKILRFPLDTLSLGDSLPILEWQPPDFSAPERWPLLALLIATAATIAHARRVRLPVADTLIAVAFGYLALRSTRHGMLFSVAAAPVVFRGIAEVMSRRGGIERAESHRPWLDAALVVTSIAAALLMLVRGISVDRNDAAIAARFPVAAVDAIEEQEVRGPIFHPYGWGGYLIWRLHPQHLVFVDGRADVYGAPYIRQTLSVIAAEPGWSEFFARWGIHAALLEPDAPLANALRAEGWHVAHESPQAVLFIDRGAEGSAAVMPAARPRTPAAPD